MIGPLTEPPEEAHTNHWNRLPRRGVRQAMNTLPIVLHSLNLEAAERHLCLEALTIAGSIVEAAKLLGITRHALKRRILKHQIEWSRSVLPTSEPVPR